MPRKADPHGRSGLITPVDPLKRAHVNFPLGARVGEDAVTTCCQRAGTGIVGTCAAAEPMQPEGH